MANIVIRNNSGFEGTEVNQTKTFSGVSTVTVTLSNYQTYTWQPGESHTLVSPYAEEALAADNRLKEVSRS